MGIHQLFWAHRARLTAMVQNTLRSRPGSIGCDLSKELPSRAVPIRNYLAILTQLGACTALHIALPPRPAGGPNLIDSESSDDGVLLSACKEQVGDALHTRHYSAPHRYHEDPSAGTVPAGYRPVTIAGILCYSNQQPPECPYTPMAAFKQLRLRARNTRRWEASGDVHDHLLCSGPYQAGKLSETLPQAANTAAGPISARDRSLVPNVSAGHGQPSSQLDPHQSRWPGRSSTTWRTWPNGRS